ncbi:flavodoxin [Vibrio sinaloensis]|uniref:flavodoxin n=1 Tax=Photobacterium sp. (strain ATCC 43367) TaxID=379097 RepID=UPI002070D5DF|nr:flavodoxin [Vibrio sinaloensis]UPQ89935.1 flavodoxin [Vibrio sinaloensis]
MSIPNIADIKNQWLYQQVEVEFPTKESLAGLALYRAEVEGKEVVELDASATDSTFNQDDIFLVDFHRLTVMFALLQASRWQKPTDQEHIVEFLTQIIYSTPCELYLGFQQGEPVAAAILTVNEQHALISDVVVKAQSTASKQDFIAALVSKASSKLEPIQQLWLEK